MKKVNNLDELVDLIGMESVEKCFTEYVMLTIAKARKWDESQGERVFHQPKCPEWGGELITTDDLTDDELKEQKENIDKTKRGKS